MPRNLKVAAVELDGASQPLEERLAYVASHIEQAAQAGAQLIVLPSQFNTGKTFLETTYEQTERLTDATMQWMCEQSRQHQVYLAGAWVIVDYDDTYQAAMIIAPDGQTWRYDQRYPLLWERVFYRDGYSIAVADTSIGRIGLMIGWDAAHPDLWERYAAKIDLLLILHAELDYSQAILRYADGVTIPHNQLSVLAKFFAQHTKNYLHNDISTQGHWLNVPTVIVGCSGEFDSILPAPYFSVQALLFGHTALWQRADENHQYAEMHFATPFLRCTQIRDCDANVLGSSHSSNEAIIVADVLLSDLDQYPPLPLDEPQPEMSTSEWVRFVIDGISGGLFTLTYRRGVRRQWGARMAPKDNNTKIWMRVIALVAIITAVIGRLFSSKR